MLFLAASFLMGVSSPFYSGPQTALMQEKVPPEYLGRVFGLYGAIMSWAMPLGLVASSLLAQAWQCSCLPWLRGRYPAFGASRRRGSAAQAKMLQRFTLRRC